MDTLPNPAKSHALRDEYADLADLYLLRLTCGCRGGGAAAFMALHDAFISILGRYRTLNLTEDEIGELLALRLEEAEATPPTLTGPLFDNLALLGARLDLSLTQQEILAFRVIVRMRRELEQFLQSLGALSESRLMTVISLALSRRPADIEQALARHGALSGSALILIEQTLQPFLTKISLVPGLANALTQRQKSLEDLIGFALKRSDPPLLATEDFTYLQDELTLLCNYLKAATKDRLQGINILLHGAPGVGKTQLARVAAKQIDATLYEVAASGASGEAHTHEQRCASYCFNQRFLAGQERAMILFDEAEDALRNLPTFRPLAGFEKRQSKAWINQLLEGNVVPTFWVANGLDYIEGAILRRFDLVIEMHSPPRSVRHSILKQAMQNLPVTEAWIGQWAQEDRISPALADRAARVLRTAGIADIAAIDRQFRRIVENSIQAQGGRLPARYPSSMRYSLEFVNASTDPQALLSGLAKRGRGRLLLYGPPGSGKTAFAHHAAEKLDRPLLLKRASDLISPFLGETERNIAHMFREATADNAVLFLDEADSFLQDRQQAVRSWEVTEVNELLTQMECFKGLFLCATNFREHLDSAALRRFGVKLRFDYLDAQQCWLLFVSTCAALSPRALPVQDEVHIRQEISLLRNLTPGDFTAAGQHIEMTGKPPKPENLLQALQEESRLKPGGNRTAVGFAPAG
jgi:transitional endoplasmic reticulum ATPase